MFLSSLFHKKGPRYLRGCFPYNTELNLGTSKFWLLKLYLQDLILKMSQMKSGTSLYLTLYGLAGFQGGQRFLVKLAITHEV